MQGQAPPVQINDMLIFIKASFFCSFNAKMPTFFGILTFKSRKNFMFS